MSSSWIMVWIPTKETEKRLQAASVDEEQQRKASIFNPEAGRGILIQRVNSEDHAETVTSQNGSPTRLPMLKEEEGEEDKTTFEHSKLQVTKVKDVLLDVPDDEDARSQLSVNSTASVQEFLERTCLEETLLTVLGILKVAHWTRQKSDDGKYLLTTFCVQTASLEDSLICLQQHGIGNNDFSSVSVVSSSIHIEGEVKKKSKSTLRIYDDEEKEEAEGDVGDRGSQGDHTSTKLERKVEKFYESIKSRMLVAEVVARIRAGGEFTFDFLMLLCLAGCIAFMGLVENSSVVLVASMLVSPLMGPILAGIFGTVIRDSKLRNQGIKHELAALFICIIIGFLLGFVFAPFIKLYGAPQWPTNEMLGRGQLRSLFVGVLIAIPSGAGVALSVLGGNAGSLVGVAISASLLPPAVNCGLFWAMAVVSALSPDPNFLIGYTLAGEQDNATNYSLPIYEINYSDNLSVEAVVLGLVSLTLTLVNIVCIIITGIGILKLKEVTPEKIPQSFSNFWKKDIKAHRDYYQTYKKDPNADQLLEEAREVLGIGQSEGLAGTFLQSVFDNAQKENDLLNIKDWIAHPPLPAARRAEREARISMVDFSSSSSPLHSMNSRVADTLKRQAKMIRLRRNVSQVEGEIAPTPIELTRKRSQTIDAEVARHFRKEEV